jgi:SAM-dependent methyltransferase
MRQTIKDLVSIVARTLPIEEPIYEFGSLQVSEQEEGFADLRPLFPGKEYVGADMRQGIGVDQILNLHRIDLPSESVGTIICVDTLEHVEYPHRALEEIHRVLKPDGIALICSVMDYPIHDYPYDYWRFTPEAFKSLLKPFPDSFIGYAGEDDFPHTVIGLGFKGDVPNLSEFTIHYREWREQQDDSHHRFKQMVKLLTPPILLPALSRIYTTIRGLTRRSS